jgi:glycerol-3-phosphate dehydrogenase (NAD(P)+)
LIISILGDGGWGTAQAILLAGNQHQVTLWGAFPDYVKELNQKRLNGKFLPGVPIPKEIRITTDIKQAVSGCELLVVAVPSKFLRSVISRLKGLISEKTILLSVAKGIESRTLFRMSQVIQEETGRPSSVLSGPSHAEEVARHVPTAVVVASEDLKTARAIQSAYMCENFRVYTQMDVVGVELGGALKNVIAIASGLVDGLKLGDNTKSALIARGVMEISRLGVELGADKETFYGLSCLGDLITTCFSPHGRNQSVGRELAKGRSVKEIISGMEMVAEGVETIASALALAKRERVDLPITRMLQEVISGSVDVHEAVHLLMTRPPKPEFA